MHLTSMLKGLSKIYFSSHAGMYLLSWELKERIDMYIRVRVKYFAFNHVACIILDEVICFYVYASLC